jgi:hypothetical protein
MVHLAACYGQLNVVKVLIEDFHADVEAKTSVSLIYLFDKCSREETHLCT